MSNKEPPDLAGVGMHVEVELIDQQGRAEPMAFDIVPAQAADLARGLLSATTPLAKAIRGRPAGAVAPYSMGDIGSVRIVAVRPSQITATIEAEERRQAVLRKALNDAERTNAEIFAASFSGKWGDYDMDAAADWGEKG